MLKKIPFLLVGLLLSFFLITCGNYTSMPALATITPHPTITPIPTPTALPIDIKLIFTENIEKEYDLKYPQILYAYDYKTNEKIKIDEIQSLPVFSVDRKNIAYINTTNILVIWNLQTGSFIFEPCHLGDISWSPDGQRIAFFNDANSLTVLDIQSGDKVNFHIEGSNLKWSPDGKTIALISQKDLYLVDLEINEPYLLVEHNAGYYGTYIDYVGPGIRGIRWSSDNKNILYDDFTAPDEIMAVPNPGGLGVYDNLYRAVYSIDIESKTRSELLQGYLYEDPNNPIPCLDFIPAVRELTDLPIVYFLMNEAGVIQENITTDHPVFKLHSCSPNGSKVAYLGEEYSLNTWTLSNNIREKIGEGIWDNFDSILAWSPDSDYIIQCSPINADFDNECKIIDVAGNWQVLIKLRFISKLFFLAWVE